MQSVPLMTAIDLFVLGVTAYVIVLYFRHREAAKRLGVSTGLAVAIAGISITGCLYLADLYAMLVLPVVADEAQAMQVMRDLHLHWSWFAVVPSTAALAFGFRQLLRRFLPRLDGIVADLRAAEAALRENQALLEARVQDRTAALARTEQRFRQFLEHSPDACHLKDADGRYLFVNRIFEEWVGVEASRIVGARFDEFGLDPAVNEWTASLDRRILDGEPVITEAMEFVVADQSPRTIEVRKFPVLDAEGNVTRIGTISRDVSVALAREAALRESEARYARAAEGSTSGIWDWDLDAGRIYFSGRLRELLAFTDERTEPAPDAIREVIHPDDWDRYRKVLWAHLAGETPVFTCEFRVVGDDGNIRWVVNRGVAQRDASGRAHRMAGSILDITDEIARRARTEEAERRLALALEHVADGVALFDADDRLVICNDTWRHDLNSAVAEILEPGVTFETYARAVLERRLIPDAVGDEDAWLERRLRERRSGRNVVERRMSDGTWRLITETVVEDGGIVLVTTPITDMKRREIALQQSEQRFRDFTEASSDWYWEMDSELRFAYVSPGLEESTGLRAQQFLGRRRHDVTGVSSDSAAWQQHLADLEAHRAFRDFIYSVDDGGGKERHIRVSGVPVFDEDGGFAGYRGVGADITAMVAAERGRASAEERLSAAIESVQDTYAVYDRGDRLVTCNEAYRRLYRNATGGPIPPGATFSDIITAMVRAGAVNGALVDPDGWLASRLERHAQASRGYSDIVQNGERWFEVAEARTSFGDTVLAARDITALKHQEQSLRESEQRLAEANRMLRLVLDTIPVRVFWKDLAGRYMGCNLNFARDVGRAVDDVIGRDDSHLPWAAKATRYRAENDRVVSTGEPAPVLEESIDFGDGLRWLRTRKVPLHGLDEEVIGVLGIYEDVTEARAAGAERDRLRLQLAAAVEQSPAGIVLTASREPRLRVFNRAAADILLAGGEAPRDRSWLTGNPPLWMMLDAGGREIPFDTSPLVRAERDGTVSRNVDIRVRLADGSERYLVVSAGPVRDETGAIDGGVAVFVDLTEQRRAEAEVRRLNLELEDRVEARTAALREAMRDLESFSYSVSHDLRAPLRHVAGYIDLLERHVGDALDEKARRYLQVIHGAADRMGDLIDDLLELSRTGRTEMRRSPVDLHALFQEIREELDVEPEREIDWRIGDLPPIEADRGLLRQLMVNLLGNAVKFTRTRSPAVIEIGAAAGKNHPGEVVYFVRDNGVGYDARYRDKLFGVFQRLHPQTEFEGTGIGLAIVHRVISRHGGRVWSESELDRGATFYFTLAPGSEHS